VVSLAIEEIWITSLTIWTKLVETRIMKTICPHDGIVIIVMVVGEIIVCPHNGIVIIVMVEVVIIVVGAQWMMVMCGADAIFIMDIFTFYTLKKERRTQFAMRANLNYLRSGIAMRFIIPMELWAYAIFNRGIFI